MLITGQPRRSIVINPDVQYLGFSEVVSVPMLHAVSWQPHMSSTILDPSSQMQLGCSCNHAALTRPPSRQSPPVEYRRDPPVLPPGLPSRDELISKLLYVMQSPIRGLAVVLQANIRNLAVVIDQIAKQKQEQAPAPVQ